MILRTAVLATLKREKPDGLSCANLQPLNSAATSFVSSLPVSSKCLTTSFTLSVKEHIVSINPFAREEARSSPRP